VSEHEPDVVVLAEWPTDRPSYAEASAFDVVLAVLLAVVAVAVTVALSLWACETFLGVREGWG
jgi:hypothetical protein